MVQNISTPNRRSIELAIFAIGFLIPLTFALFTNHAWEDWYITFRASKNLALGNGLVYQVGERLHTYTSPLGALIPAAISFATGNTSDDLVLWIFRLFNCVLIGLTAVGLYRIGRSLKFGAIATFLLIALFCLDCKTIDYSINGMETAILVSFLCLTMYAHFVPTRYPTLLLGLGWAGLMWSRPDSFVYIGGLGLGMLVFHPESCGTNSRVQLFKRYCFAGLIAAVLYAPWLIWTTSYYGTFVPHTVLAKGLNKEYLSAKYSLLFPIIATYSPSMFDFTFSPAYAGMGGWPKAVCLVSRYLGLVCAFAWLLPRVPRYLRALSFASLVGQYYLNLVVIQAAAWYIPVLECIDFVILAALFQTAFTISPQKLLKPIYAVCTLLLVAEFIQFGCVAYQMRVQQQVIENDGRKEIGLWLKANAKPKDRVFLECLGYIGHFSNLKMVDFPGLSSKEVVEARKSKGINSLAGVIDDMKPEWLVLRPNEVKGVNGAFPELLAQEYEVAKTFSAEKEVASYRFLPGRGYFFYDEVFVVYHRKL